MLLVMGLDGCVFVVYVDDGFYLMFVCMVFGFLVVFYEGDEDEDVMFYLVILVFEFDLFDNWGMVWCENVLLVDWLFVVVVGDIGWGVSFDLM